MFKKTLLSVAVSGVLMMTGGFASAAASTVNLPVTASVSAKCNIAVGGTGLAFGAYDPIVTNLTAPLTATGAVEVTCAKNASSLTIGMGNGANFLVKRRMTDGADFLLYDVGQPPSNTPGAACTFPAATAWDSVNVLALSAPPSKAMRSYNVCGSIPGGQDVAAGLPYADTIVATINF